MKRIIHLEATPEPLSYHNGASGEAYFAIHTALEVQRTIAGDTEATARAEHADFLARLKKNQILMLKIKSDLSAVETVTQCSFAAQPVTGDEPDLMSWLDGRKSRLIELRKLADHQATDELTFYLTPKKDDIDPNAVTLAQQTTATDLLRASLNWTAPVPQRLGLLSLVKTDKETWNDLYVFVPYEEGSPPSPSDFTVSAEQEAKGARIGFDISYAYPNFADVTCRTPLAVDYEEPDGPANSVFNDDGSINHDAEADAVFRLVATLEAETASRLWQFVPMVSFSWKGVDSYGDKEPDTLEKETYQTELKWYAEHTLLTLFDLLLLAMSQPAPAPLLATRILTIISDGIVLASSGAGVKAAALGEDEVSAAAKELLTDFLSLPWSPDRVWQMLRETPEAELASRAPKLSKLFDEKLIEGADAQTYAAELSDLALLIEDETGLERIIIEMLAQAFGEQGEKLSAKLNPDGRYNAAVLGGLQAFQAFLENEWNAAEAVRRDVGRVFSRALVDHTQPATAASIKDNLGKSDWFKFRALGGGGSTDALKPLREALPQFGATPTTKLSTKLENDLDSLFETSVNGLIADPTAAATFRPDPAPQPLPIRIAAGLKPEIIDKVNGNITGFGVIVQASHASTASEAAHASIVRIEQPVATSPKVYAALSILPALPAINDGSTELCITYRGLPLNSASQIDSSKGGPILDQIQRAERDAAMPPYAVADANLNVTGTPHAPPPLAYGYSYSAKAFWVANSGVLPFSVRNSADAFAPKNPVYQNGLDAKYLRRTAISESTIAEQPGTERIGVIPKGVFPLAQDYPRLSLSRVGSNSALLDLFRRADGGGRVWKQDGASIESLTLYDFAASSGAALVVDAWTTGGVVKNNLTVSGTGAIRTIDVSGISAAEFWLRLSLSAAGTVSFADPTYEDREARRTDNHAILLVAPSPETNWQDEYIKPALSTLTPPGVSFADFECWAANPTLMARLTGFNDKGKDGEFLDALRESQAQFEFFDEVYANLINQLPDPAVDAMLVTLEVSDLMNQGVPVMAKEDIVELSPYKIDPLLIKTASYDNLTTLVDTIVKAARVSLNVSCGSFNLLVSGRAITVSVPSGWVAALKIEPMVSAEYFSGALQAIVPDLAAYQSSRPYTHGGKDWQVFLGARLQIEGMSVLQAKMDENDALFLDPASQVALHPVIDGTARGYRLELDPSRDKVTNWRQFGEADVITQRWRPSGRPIYRWIDPAGFRPAAADKPDLSPAIEIKALKSSGPTSQDAIENFEHDAFFDRLPDDAERSRIRMVASPKQTSLGRFDWSAASATYFRHRLALRSRYAPAMRDAKREVASSKNNAWTLRIAIQADSATASITRPQIRSFLPMLRRVDKDDDLGVPAPLICVLGEKPYAQLGLADRVVAGIETVHNYRITGSGDNKKLRLHELRKEIGPDPRLSYFGIQNDHSRQALLRVEGPVGLHFDAATTANPAFSNSQFLLHLEVSEDREDLEESFAGVSLRRFAAPGWMWSGSAQRKAAPTSKSPAWWLDLELPAVKQDAMPKSGSAGAPAKLKAVEFLKLFAGDNEIVRLSLSDPEVLVAIAKEAAYPSSGAGFVMLCTADGRNARLSLLHRRLNESHYCLSVMSRPLSPADDNEANNNVANGIIDQLQLIASIEYNADGPLTFREADGTTMVEPDLHFAAASDATFVEWIRTNRNLSEFQTPTRRVSVSSLAARLNQADGRPRVEFFDSNKPVEGRLRLRSPVSTRKYPLHVRRHLALVLRRKSTDLGREIGLYNQAVLLSSSGGSLDIDIADLSTDNTASIAEVETRAEVLLNADSTTKAVREFREAKFDLVSTRPERRRNKKDEPPLQALRQLRFAVRVPFGDFGHKRTLTYTLSAVADDGGDAVKILEMAETAPDGANELAIVVSMPDGSKDDLTWQMIFESDTGTVQQDPHKAVGASALRDARTLCLEMKRKDSDGNADREDLWTDIALLHSDKTYLTEKGGRDAVDFDWLFNEPVVEDHIAEAVSTTRLNTIPEVQARLIGLSDPIRVIPPK